MIYMMRYSGDSFEGVFFFLLACFIYSTVQSTLSGPVDLEAAFFPFVVFF
jgi:hypothetical protein